jgi:hypothetical protein
MGSLVSQGDQRIVKASSDLVLKAVATVCFVVIAVSVVIASSSVATGYELSIYAGTPILVWPLLLISVIGGIWLITNQAFGDAKTIHWGVVVGPLVLANLTILLLPMLRGYYLYASHDSLAHTGMGLDITLTGHATTDNVYPTTHILISLLSQVCDIAPTSIERFLPVFLNTVFAIMLMYLVGKATLPKRGQILLVVAFASGFLLNSLHVMLYAQVISFFLVLLALYLRLDESINQRLVGRILLIIVLFSIPYSHPAPSLMIIFFLLTIELANAFYRKKSEHLSKGQISVTLALISAITFFTWISSFVIFDVKVNKLWANLRDPLAAPHLQTLETAIGEASMDQVVSTFLKMYGDSVICLLLAVTSAAIVTRKAWAGKKGVSGIWALTMVFLVAVPIQLLIFTGARSQTVGRFVNLNFAILLSPVLAAYALYQILRRAGKATFALALSILLAFWIISALGIYHSPWIAQPGWQITRMDIQGIEWFLQNKDNDTPFSAMGYPHGVQYIAHGYRSAFSREDLMESIRQIFYDVEQTLPTRFGYDHLTTLGESMTQDQYLIVAKRFQIATADPVLSSEGLTVVPLFWPGFQPTDFDRLEEDPSVSKLYSNGEWDVWQVKVWPRGD